MLQLDVHSPVNPLDFPQFRESGLTLHIKRDDLIHPFISGNKWRKLKYILQDASDQRKTQLVTFGGVWSNHLLAIACAGARFGFKTTAFVRGEQVSNANLSLCRIFGMELRFVDRTAYRDKPALFQRYFAEDQTAYFVDEGGYGAAGAKGCAEIIDELGQIYDHIFCACGTGTTLAGLCMGKIRNGLDTTIHGIPVLAGSGFIKAAVAELCADGGADDLVLHTDYHFGGYARTTPELDAFIRRFCANTGILIEPVYTGKLLYGIFDLASRGHFRRGETILALHTGGLTGILGMHERLAQG
ncbi:1-aminocyclopropane-1-carboxylate deaminase [Parapedobacter defluvii]|uniref:1-aminocyclopropane-1-carboxylate deaminase n=1 Tax=Parapedobacter defluvii TaxID=2045106 RepID=A0ABQ1LUF6_9SPHI|nr:pyridoxal-phosphate dependent enzyme [Parapedobacter defluvii]RQP19669.1 MAG: 1-aminocyclopropane-1-carboxylate deaminase/D-cysteine desulfhydrase [Parapedobacter sp.]GGC29179.1 1-aminocyclopropane-1-carboxylate deaminase [Parapedobacter defluvii]